MKNTRDNSAADSARGPLKDLTRQIVSGPSRESAANFEAGARKAQVAFSEALKKIRQSGQEPQKK